LLISARGGRGRRGRGSGAAERQRSRASRQFVLSCDFSPSSQLDKRGAIGGTQSEIIG